eukprot:scaffold34594_cov165-Amphora_coffeaeformis.AAC.5
MSFSKELNSEDVFNAIDGRNVYENGELRAVDMTSCTTNPEGFRGRLMELTAFHPGPGHENDEPVPFTLFVVEDGIKRQYIPHDEAGTTFLTNFLEDATKDDFDMATPIETFVVMGTSVYFVGMKPRKRLHGIIETVKRRNADRKELNKVKDDVDELKDCVADDDEFRLKTARRNGGTVGIVVEFGRKKIQFDGYAIKRSATFGSHSFEPPFYAVPANHDSQSRETAATEASLDGDESRGISLSRDTEIGKATGVQESLTDEQSKSIETLVSALDKLPKSKSPSYVATTMDTEWIKMVVNKIDSDGRYHHIFPTFISSTKTRYINTSNMNVLFSIAGETGKDVSLFK